MDLTRGIIRTVKHLWYRVLPKELPSELSYENWNFLAFPSSKSKKSGNGIADSKLKKFLSFQGEPLRVFYQCFFRCFHLIANFYYCWLHLFISPALGFFITVCSGVFISPLIFTIVFRVISFRKLFLPWLIFVRYFVFMLLYREC